MPTAISHIQFQYGYSIGKSEQSGPGFVAPLFVGRGKGDLLYVISRGFEYRPNGVRITVCTVGEEYVTEFGRGVIDDGIHEFSSADGSLVWPTSLAFDKEWNVYVADEWLNRISIFTKDGEYLGKWGTAGDGDGELNGPSGLAFDKDENLYLTDTSNDRIQKFTKQGKFLAKWGTRGRGGGEFNMPWGIDIDRKGDVYVADWRNDRIQKFGPDGQFLMQFGSSGNGDGQLNRPTGVAVDKDGVIYVADWKNNRLQVFDAEGGFVTQRTGEATISKWGKNKLDANAEMWAERDRAQGLEREKLFWGPTGVEVDDENRIFVVDSARSRIQVYRKLASVFSHTRL